MKIHTFTRTEADYLQCVCNFTPDENTLFELRLQEVSLERCAELMNRTLDAVKQLSVRVNNKIKKEI